MYKLVLYLFGLLISISLLTDCTQSDTTAYNCPPAPEVFVYEEVDGGANVSIELGLNSGIFSAPPSFAIWANLPNGELQTIYVTCKAATGNWSNSEQSGGLPVWDNKRTIEGITYEASDLDAVTTATPTRSNFTLWYQVPDEFFGDTISIALEFNLPGDYNDYYTRNFGDNGQPSIIWQVDFVYDGENVSVVNPSRVVGRSHATGADSKIYGDLIGITTAKDLVTGMIVKKK